MQVDVGNERVRLDKYLSSVVSSLSRAAVVKLIKDGKVKVNRNVGKPAQMVQTGDLIYFELPTPKIEVVPTPDLVLNIVFEDDDILVIAKPPGLTVHGGAGVKTATLVDILQSKQIKLSKGYTPERPGIVHRLDRDTSGLLIVAKTDLAQDDLHKQFKEKTVKRIYHAITYGAMDPREGTIKTYLLRHTNQRKKRTSFRDPKTKKIVRPQDLLPLQISLPDTAKLAITHYRFLRQGLEGLYLAEATLETGRTHQIRVHFSEGNTPIVGDRIYLFSPKFERFKNKSLKDYLASFSRCALHARQISFSHPITKKSLTFTSEYPDDIRQLMKFAEL